MGKLAANQKGFELVIVAAVIVVAAVLGISGWLIYRDHYKTKSAGADSTTTTSQSTTPTNSAPSTKPIQSATKYLTVTEWGVSLPLPASIEKAYYVVPTGAENNGIDGKPGFIFVSDHSLDSACGVLTATGPGTINRLGEIMRVQPNAIDPRAPGGNEETFAQVYPGGATVNGWYYVFNGQPATDACNKASTSASVVAGFKSAAASTVSSSAAASAQ